MSSTFVTYVAVLSGPEETRARAVVALEDARVPLLPDDHHAHMSTDGTLETDDGHGLLVVACRSVDAAVGAVDAHGWRLRLHREMPETPPVVVDELAEIRAELAVLKARIG